MRLPIATSLLRQQIRPTAVPIRGFAASALKANQWIPSDVKLPLSEEHKAIVLSTAPVLAEHGNTVTRLMYQTMIGENPELRNVFSMTAQANNEQPHALAQSVHDYAANIYDLGPLVPTVVRIAEKHAALNIQPEQYAIVAKNLFGALGTVLGDALTPQIAEAWYNAYWQLAKIFIDAEQDLYNNAPFLPWKDFKITKKTVESQGITSFELTPVDGTQLAAYKPGQFITIRVWSKELFCWQNRHYSLSDKWNKDHYRVSVKLEGPSMGHASGVVSSVLHSLNEGDVVKGSFPVGSFSLPDPMPKNLTLISAGVGITPNLSILNTVINLPEADRPRVNWLQGVRTAEDHAFKNHVEEMVQVSNGTVRSTIFYDMQTPVPEGIVEGQINAAELDPELLGLDHKDTHYYVCGPTAFMNAVKRDLINRGVPMSKVHVEAFRAGEV